MAVKMQVVTHNRSW